MFGGVGGGGGGYTALVHHHSTADTFLPHGYPQLLPNSNTSLDASFDLPFAALPYQPPDVDFGLLHTPSLVEPPLAVPSNGFPVPCDIPILPAHFGEAINPEGPQVGQWGYVNTALEASPTDPPTFTIQQTDLLDDVLVNQGDTILPEPAPSVGCASTRVPSSPSSATGQSTDHGSVPSSSPPGQSSRGRGNSSRGGCCKECGAIVKNLR